MTAIVCNVLNVHAHKSADRLDVVMLGWRDGEGVLKDATIVTGPHYRTGQRGVYIPAGSILPGYLAEDLWLCGRGNANRWHPVVFKVMRGIPSPGVFCGATWSKNCRDEDEEWRPWPGWRDWWKPGDDVGPYLGIQ